MILNPQSKPGRLVMALLAEKIAALRALACAPATPENEAADAHNDATLYQVIRNELQAELDAAGQAYPQWVTKGKSITQLITELGSFEDQNLEVRLTFDGGACHKPISILTRRDGFCMLENCEW
jgi:hypothetical protein